MALFNKWLKREQGASAPEAAAVPQPSPDQGKKKDRKLPFDTWLAVKGATHEEISNALDVQGPAFCDWDTGISKVHSEAGSLFITDEINEWNLVIGSSLPDLAYRLRTFAWLEGLGKTFSSVCYFAASPVVSRYCFAQYEGGELVRAYATVQGEIKHYRGAVSAAEQSLGLRFPANDDELFSGVGITALTTETIATLAGAWSVDPFLAQGHGGVLGKLEKF